MSASAIARRRAAAATAPPPPSSQFGSPFSQQMPAPPMQQQHSNNRMLTLTEVIALVDSRLTHLEVASQQYKLFQTLQSTTPVQTQQPAMNESDLESTISRMLEPHLEEFNHRYEILATEILNIKNVVMKLQSYTLDVNKMLVDERIRVLADPLLEGATDGGAEVAVDDSLATVTAANEEDQEPQNDVESDPLLDTAVTTTLEEQTTTTEPVIAAAKKPRKKRNVLSI